MLWLFVAKCLGVSVASKSAFDSSVLSRIGKFVALAGALVFSVFVYQITFANVMCPDSVFFEHG